MKNAAILALVLAAYVYTGTEDYAQESAMQTTNLQATTVVEDDNGAEVEVTITFDYQPYERRTRDYPGCPADITQITAVDAYDNEYYATNDARRDEAIEAACWRHVEVLQQAEVERHNPRYVY